VLCPLVKCAGMSYNFRTVIGDWSQTEVRQRLDRVWTGFGQRSRGRELVRGKRVVKCEICNRM